MRQSTASRVGSWPASALVAAMITVAALIVWTRGSDRSQDIALALSRLPWIGIATAALLPALVAIHYLSAALALRAVSDSRVAVGPTTLVQLAAAATNRLVPNGIGGAGVNLRYLLRVALTPGAAASAMAALALVGGITDAGYAISLSAAGAVLGLGGAPHEFHLLAASGLRTGQQHSWILPAALVALAAILLRRGRGRLISGAIKGARDALGHARSLLMRPRGWTAAAGASLVATIVMSLGFALSAAAGTTTPLPAFLGVTEVALVGGLVLGGYTSGSPIASVVIFRAISYWLPLPIGLWAARRLRRTGLL